MQQPDDPYSPAERAKRRRVLSSRPTGEPGSEPTAQKGTERIEQMMESYKAAIQQQLEEGLSAIRHTAGKLMHEVANEVWRTTEGDKDQARSPRTAASTARPLPSRTSRRCEHSSPTSRDTSPGPCMNSPNAIRRSSRRFGPGSSSTAS